MSIFSPSGLSWGLEFGFVVLSFQFHSFVFTLKMFDRAAIVRPLDRLGYCGACPESASARRTGPLEHTHINCTCTEPPSRLPPPPCFAPYTWIHDPTANQHYRYSSMTWPLGDSSAPQARVRLTFFRGAGNLSNNLLCALIKKVLWQSFIKTQDPHCLVSPS